MHTYLARPTPDRQDLIGQKLQFAFRYTPLLEAPPLSNHSACRRKTAGGSPDLWQR